MPISVTCPKKSLLWPKVRQLEERKDWGKALSEEEEIRLLAAITDQTSPNRWQVLGTFVRVALLTGMRSGEIMGLTWGQVDFARRIVTVGKAKSTAGTGRQIPMNSDLFTVLSAHAAESLPVSLRKADAIRSHAADYRRYRRVGHFARVCGRPVSAP